MQKIPFADGSKTSSAKVTIDNVDYPVTPARYTGATPLSATVLNTMQTNIENAIDQNADNIGGEDYDSTATYEEGDIVKHEGQLYVANQDIDEPEEWTEAHWTATNVLSSAGGNEVVIGSETDVTSKTKLLIDEDDETDVFSEVVDSLSGNELDKAPSVHAVNNVLTYSTDEKVVGKWFNKPLYEKTLTFSVTHTASDNQTKSYTLAHNLTNIDKIFIDRGKSYSSGGQLAIDNVYFNGALQVISIFTRALINSTNITYNIYRNADYTDDLIITVLYTKTTD